MKKLLVLFGLWLLIQACYHQPSQESYVNSTVMPEAEMSKMTETPEASADGGSSMEQALQPRVIRNAYMTISVDDYNRAIGSLKQLVKRMQATVANEAEQRSSFRIENNLQIRIAPEQLDSFLLEVERLALHVDSKSVDSRDVTREFIDMETRLAAKRATLERYREILRSAKTVSDIMAVEQQMRSLIEEIESVEGQLRYLRDQVQLSTVHLTLYQAFDRPDVARPSFWRRIGTNFAQGWHGFQDFLVGMVYLWPLWLIIALGAVWVWRRYGRRR